MPEPIVVTKQMIEQLFDGAATSYDRVGPGIFKQFGARLVELMTIAPGAHVLDVATGAGSVLLPAAMRVRSEGRVIGIDLSGKIIKEADRAVRAYGLANVELSKMDAEHLDFPDQAFDAVTCAFSLFLFPDMDAALREMYRVCKPGGRLGVTMFNKVPHPFNPGLPILIQQFREYGVILQMPHQLGYAPEELDALLGRFGFVSIETRSETSDVVYESAEDWWAFQLTTPMSAAILSMDEDKRARFKDEYFSKLRPIFQHDGLHLSLSVIYALVQR